MKLKNSISLKKLINEHKIILSVYGLGNVGGPIAAAWLKDYYGCADEDVIAAVHHHTTGRP